MKKITLLLLAALVIGCGASSAQNKFKKSSFGNKSKAKTEQKAEPKPKAEAKQSAEKATSKTESKFQTRSQSKATDKVTTAKKTTDIKKTAAVEKASMAPNKKAAAPKPHAVQAAVDKSNLNGFFTNTYSDGIGGTSTHRLTVEYDEASGTVKGKHTNESGVERTYHGKLVGDKVVCYYDEDGDEFAEMKLYDSNTIKLEGFTGTFKRNNSDIPTVSASPSGQSGAAAVDREGLEAIKKYMKEKEEQQN